MRVLFSVMKILLSLRWTFFHFKAVSSPKRNPVCNRKITIFALLPYIGTPLRKVLFISDSNFRLSSVLINTCSFVFVTILLSLGMMISSVRSIEIMPSLLAYLKICLSRALFFFMLLLGRKSAHPSTYCWICLLVAFNICAEPKSLDASLFLPRISVTKYSYPS